MKMFFAEKESFIIIFLTEIKNSLIIKSYEFYKCGRNIVASVFLSIKNISKTYNAVNALDNINLEIKHGEIHCIIGENGCGKSTLMKIIAGVIPPDPTKSGCLEIDGKPMHNYNSTISMRKGIQVIYQDLSLFPNLTVTENININDRIENRSFFINWKNAEKTARAALQEVSLDVDINTNISDLSIAQRQLIAICRAITNNVRLLIMDEPTASLGKKDIDHLITIIQKLKARGIAVIFIGHKLDEVLSIADRITIMRDSHIIRTIDDVAEYDEHTLASLMTGKQIAYDTYNAEFDSDSVKLLEVKHFSKKRQFFDINLKLYKGEILGIIGLVGSGRTELVSTIFGLQQPDSGEIFIEEQPVRISNVNDAIKLGIGLVPENRLSEGLFNTKSIKNNINITTLDKHINKVGLLSASKLDSNSSYWVEMLKIKTPDQNNPASSLSGGNQQRIVLAKWMSNNSKILILDGPTIGIDIGAKAEIHQIIRQAVKEKAIGVIMVTDEIGEVLQNASRILVMHEGKIIFDDRRINVNEKILKTTLARYNREEV